MKPLPVFSAGNRPAMRSPILGATIADREQLKAWVRISTRLTHTDPKAEQGAWLIALATRLVSEQETGNPSDFLALSDEEMI